MRLEGLHVYHSEGNGMSAELLGRNSVGLQARFLTGNFHEPLLLTREQLQGISENGVEGIRQEVGNRYQNASLKQRREYQQAKNLTYETWRARFDTYLQSIRNDTEQADRKSFLEMIGISDEVTADDFYREYLQDGSQVVKFVDDIESSVSTEQIRRHADIIRALGNTFGYATSAVIEHLIHGVRNARDNTDEFIESVSGSANVPRTLHNPLLRIIHDDSDYRTREKTSSHRTATVSSPRTDQNRHAVLFSDLLRRDGEGLPSSRGNEPTRNDSLSQPTVDQSEGTEVHQERPPEADLRVLFREPEPKSEKRDRNRQDTTGSDGGDQGKITFVPFDLPVARKPHASSPPPAPLHDQETEDDSDPLTDKEIGLAMRYLSYSDINPPPEETPSDGLVDSVFAKQYIREFVTMTEEYGKPLVLETAIDAGEFIGELLDAVELDRTSVSRSPSWYLWYAVQSRFLSNHPHLKVDVGYHHPFDPLMYKKEGATREQIIRSRQANDAIIDRMLGWEIYRQKRKKISVFRHLDPTDKDEWERLQVLLNEEPKDDGANTLSPDKLIEIGRIVRTGVLKE